MDLVSKLGRVNLKLCIGIAGVQLIGYALYKAIKTAFFSKLLKVSFKMSTMFGHFQYFFLRVRPVYFEVDQVDLVRDEMLQSL